MFSRLLSKWTKKRAVVARAMEEIPDTRDVAVPLKPVEENRPDWFAKEDYSGGSRPRLGPHYVTNIDRARIPISSLQDWANSLSSEPTRVHCTKLGFKDLVQVEPTWRAVIDREHKSTVDAKLEIFKEYIRGICPKCSGYFHGSTLQVINNEALQSYLASGAARCGSIPPEFHDRLSIYGDAQCDSTEFLIFWLGDKSNSTGPYLISERIKPPAGGVYFMPLEPGLIGACRVIRKGDPSNMPSWDRWGITMGLLVMATSWIGTSTPDLQKDEQKLRLPLRKTFGNWQGAEEIAWVGSSKEVPANFQFIGILPTTKEEYELTSRESNSWGWFADQMLKQALFDKGRP